MCIDLKTNLIRRYSIKMASYTYTIYLFHTTAEGFAKSLFFKIPIENYLIPDLCFIAKASCIIACGIFVPYILHKIVVSKSRLFSFLIGVKYLLK
jgi:hypothetical protein